jgi:NADPH2 dehydrogenase
MRLGWVGAMGLGRMALTYPEMLWDATKGRAIDRKRIYGTFSDCTTAARKRIALGMLSLGQLLQTVPARVNN